MNSRAVVAVAVLQGTLVIGSVACTDDQGLRTTVVPRTSRTMEVGTVPDDGTEETRTIYLWDPRTGEAEPVLSVAADRPEEVADADRSPDGSRVAYEVDHRGAAPQIYVLEADGSQGPLTDLAGGAWDPAWSPDGTMIAFVGAKERGQPGDIYVADPEGVQGTRLVAGTPDDDGDPDWSPDGERIAFDSTGSTFGEGEIWVVSIRVTPDRDEPLQTQRMQQLAELHHGANEPSWSPDGRWIAYRMWERGYTANGKPYAAWLHVVRPDGSQDRQVARLGGEDEVVQQPSWSPTGHSIIVERGNWRGTLFDVFLVDPRTGQARRILHHVDDPDPSWGADGILLTLWEDESPPSEPARAYVPTHG